jgi:hypothetical protein
MWATCGSLYPERLSADNNELPDLFTAHPRDFEVRP